MVRKKDKSIVFVPGIVLIVFCMFIAGNIFSFAANSSELSISDSTNINRSPVIKSGAGDGRDTLKDGPGEIIENPYLPEQDSAYSRAMGLAIPTERRLINDFKLFMGYFRPDINKEETIWEAYERAFRIPQTVYFPSSVEIVQRYEAMQRSQHVDGINSLPNIGTQIQIPFDAIGRFFGIVEDVSSVITYDLIQRSEVEILIYNIQARLIRTVYKATQIAGRYEIVWNGRDDSGLKVPPGDYIAEIKIGKDRLKLKRIRIE